MAEALGGLTGSIQGTVTGLGNKGMQWLDRIFPPETRAKVMNAITKFSSEKPMLAVRLCHFAVGYQYQSNLILTIFRHSPFLHPKSPSPASLLAYSWS